MSDLVDDVLYDVNRLREVLGFPALPSLPQGVREHPSQCPLARSMPFEVEVSYSHLLFRSYELARDVAAALGSCVETLPEYEKWQVSMPSSFTKFVSKLDAGELPELELEEEPRELE